MSNPVLVQRDADQLKGTAEYCLASIGCAMCRISLAMVVVMTALTTWSALADTITGSVRPIDGDTFEIACVVIRLADIDAPEISQKCRRRRHHPDHLVPTDFDESAMFLREEELLLCDRDAKAPSIRHPHAPSLDAKWNVIDRRLFPGSRKARDGARLKYAHRSEARLPEPLSSLAQASWSRRSSQPAGIGH